METCIMEMVIDKEIIEEIERVILPTFGEFYLPRCVNFASVAFALQAILGKLDEAKEVLNNNEDD